MSNPIKRNNDIEIHPLDPGKVFEYHEKTFLAFLDGLENAYEAEDEDNLFDLLVSLHNWMKAVRDEKESLMR